MARRSPSLDHDAPLADDERAALAREDAGLGPDGRLTGLAALGLEAPPDPAFTARVMSAVERHRRGPWHRLVALLLRPRTVRYRLVGAVPLVAGAAVVAVLALGRAGDRAVPRAPLAPPVAARPAPAPAVDAVEVLFTLAAPGARSVAVAGDFNGWSGAATPLADLDGDGIWSAAAPVAPGRHTYAFVVDGQRLVADPGAARLLPDGFGGQLGLLLDAAPARAAGPPGARATLPEAGALAPIRTELATLIAELDQAGLPADPVVFKVREGLLKRIPAADLLLAARGLASTVRLAAALVRKHAPGRTPHRDLVLAVVVARKAGVSLAAVDEVLGVAAPHRPVVAALAVGALVDLVARGYPAARATDLVLAVVARAGRERDLPRIRGVVEAARAAGLEPRRALDQVTAAVERGVALGEAGELAHRQARQGH